MHLTVIAQVILCLRCFNYENIVTVRASLLNDTGDSLFNVRCALNLQDSAAPWGVLTVQ